MKMKPYAQAAISCAIFRAILRECENAMPLAMPENAHLVQTDALSHTAGIALWYEMSRNIAHALSQKSSP